nr:L1 [Erethizon dorsatum papillomavirus 2]
MAWWLPQKGKIFVPPPNTPVTKILRTDDYVTPTAHIYHASTERLCTVGHPYFEIKNGGDVVVPKVSGNQYRVFRLKLPDPNLFAVEGIYNHDKERLVWKLLGIEIGRGGPLSVGSSGHPVFNKLRDTENPNSYFVTGDEGRQNVSFDPKQVQVFIIGCKPCTGEHWDVATPCTPLEKKQCPPLELVHSIIQDGDMFDIGLGNINFKALQQNLSDAPLELVNSIAKWPDFLKMTADAYGDSMFFFGRREQVYARHLFCRNGAIGDSIPTDPRYVIPAKVEQQKTLSSSVYFCTPSGSLVSSDGQLFNRPFWLQRAQGKNNGVCWGNQLFVTVADNTRNVNFTISRYEGEDVSTLQEYEGKKFHQYLRHTEQYEISIVIQMCKVSLDTDVLAHINLMNPDILEDWNLGFIPPPPNSLQDTYRFLNSLATRCPTQEPPAEKEDPYKDYSFWEIDLSERLSTELDQSPLGRKFLYQAGIGRAPRRAVTVKRKATTVHRTKKKRKTTS